MRGKTLVVLAVLVAALAAFAWLVDRDRPGTADREERAERVTRFDPDEVTGLVIDSPDGRVLLERETPLQETDENDGDSSDDADEVWDWWLREPIDKLAERTRVDSFLDGLATLDRHRELEDVTAADYGLDAPRWHLTLRREDGDLDVAVGDELPTGDYAAVRVNGGAIQIAPTAWLSQASVDPDEWRSKQLFRRQRSEVTEVALERDGERLVLEKGAGNKYRITEPIADLAERGNVDALLSTLLGLRAQTFLGSVQEQPWTAIGAATVTFEDGSDWQAELGEGHLVLDDEVIEVDAPELTAALRRPLEEWRSKVWSPLQPYEVQTATIFDTEGEINLNRVDGNWNRDGEPVGFAPVNDFLYALAGAEAEHFVEPPPAAEPELTATLAGEDGEFTLTLVPDAGACVAEASGRPKALRLAAETCDEVRQAVTDLRAAEAIGASETEAEE